MSLVEGPYSSCSMNPLRPLIDSRSAWGRDFEAKLFCCGDSPCVLSAVGDDTFLAHASYILRTTNLVAIL